MRVAARISVSAAVALALSSAPLSADRFDDALAAAQANLATPEGRAYAASVAARFDEKKLRDALLGCAESLPPEDAPPFTVLMEMTADGRPTLILLRPPAPVAVCFRWVLRETTFPRPPGPAHWVSVEADARRSPGAPVIPTPGVATATVPPTRTPAAPPPPSPTPASLPGPIVRYLPPEGIHVDANRPDLAALRRTLAASSTAWIGPLLAQSDGAAPDDARLEPYWSLAEELDRPIAIALGPEAPGASSPGYRVALGDPLKLESVLTRHPMLRIVVAGAGWPFGDAMAALMWRYPRVYVDVSRIASVLPRTEFHAYLRRLMDAASEERILCDCRADEDEAIRSAEFLTEAQKQAILGGNAARLCGD